MEDKSLNTCDQSEKGQNVVLIAIMMMVLIGMLALVLDGGFSYASRRQAQNAADAGALAGANILCDTGDQTAANAAAVNYVDRNDGAAAQPAPVIQFGDHIITVTTTIVHNSFFAGLIGQNAVTTRATAAAGCFAPCESTGVLPVAWACHPPVGGNDDDSCEIQYGDPDSLYIIMDSLKAGYDYLCQDPPNSGTPSNALDCDIDNNGVNDILIGGGRSWLNLDGGSASANELKDWISGGYAEEIPIHIWLPESNGDKAASFKAAKDRVGDDVILPVFNDYCKQGVPNEDPLCIPKWHAEDTIKLASGGSFDYYHIISFSVFHVTGVSTGSGPGKCTGDCTAKNALVDSGALDKNAQTIEGYFVEGYEPGFGGKCDYDAGAYTIYLDH